MDAVATPVGNRRLQWCRDVMVDDSYTRLDKKICGLLAWDFHNSRTGLIVVSVEKLADTAKCTERAVQTTLAKLIFDRRMKIVGKAAPGHTVKRQLTFPPDANEAQNQPAPEPEFVDGMEDLIPF